MQQALIILGRYPHPGKVKTRLSKDLGDEITANFYKSLLEKLFLEVKKIKDVKVFFCYADLNDKTLIKNWLPGINLIDPVSDNINKNLSNAFEQIFKQKITKVISVASDVPGINKLLIQQAFKKLDSKDFVIGPDKTGGIYLYGTKKHFPEFFEFKFERGETIFNTTVENIKKNDFSVDILETLLDIDTIDDFNFWRSLNPDIETTYPSIYNHT